MSASVTYKDEIITTVKNTSKDLLTSGKYLEDDITITDITSLQAKSNISPTTSSQTVLADAGYDGLSSVQINAIPSDYIGTDIPRRSSISVSQDNNTIHVEDGYYENDIDTSMGACTVTGASVLIDNQGDATGSIIVGRGGYINSGSHAFYVDDVVTPRSSSDLTASGATVSVPYGYYSADASKTVASGSAGTPVATKGTVSNHAVNVTPSVMNTTGYITGGTKTGTAVTVSASELDSGTKSITANGNSQDVVGYASVNVNVPNSYSSTDEGKVVSNGALVSQTSATYTENDTYDTTLVDEVTVNVSGGVTEPTPLDVDFVDYDGTLLYTYTAADFANLSALPANPSHTGLTAQGWNWTLADAQAFVAKHGTLVIGQNYTTSDGKTRAYLTLTEDVKSFEVGVYFVATKKNGVTVYWGDGTSETSTANDNANSQLKHTYNVAGDYVIELAVTNGTVALGYGGSNNRFLGNTGTQQLMTSQCFNKIEIGNNVTGVYRQCFYNLTHIESISIPTSVTTYGDSSNGNVFANCMRLKGIVIPSGTTLITTGFVQGNHLLKYIALPKSVTDIKINAFIRTFNLRKFTIASMAGSLTAGNYLVSENYGTIDHFVAYGTYTEITQCFCRSNFTIIKNKIYIPSTVTSILQYAFNSTYIKEIHFESTTPPTLKNTNAFTDWAGLHIYVPQGCLSAYQNASNWSSHASYIMEESS